MNNIKSAAAPYDGSLRLELSSRSANEVKITLMWPITTAADANDFRTGWLLDELTGAWISLDNGKTEGVQDQWKGLWNASGASSLGFVAAFAAALLVTAF